MTINSVTLSQALIQKRSVSGERDEGALQVLEDALTPLGFVCHRLAFDGGGSYPVDNLYAKYEGKKGSKNLCFAGHTDVVPVGDVDAWSVDPFAADIVDGMLIGRGAVDMKAAIACWVAAISDVLEQGDFDGSLSLLITGDEEADAVNGTVKMLQWLRENDEKLDDCIVGEPTNPLKLGEMIKIGRRGSLGCKLTVQGMQGHVAYPDLAHNPATDLVKILAVMVGHSFDEGTEFFPATNMEVTTIDIGNEASNMIAAQAVAHFNTRFRNLHSCASLYAWFDGQCKNVTGNYTLEKGSQSEAFITPPGALSAVVKKAVDAVTGLDAELSTTGGTSDARFIKDMCSVVEFGLINQTAHKVDECVAVKDIEQLADIYARVITHYFAV